MFKIISKLNLIQNVPVIKITGEESVACLVPKGTIFTRRITPTLQYLLDNNQISVVETNENLKQEVKDDSKTSIGTDMGSFAESIDITEFNSEDEKEKIRLSELDSIVEISNIEESVKSEEIVKPKRGRKKKTTGGDS